MRPTPSDVHINTPLTNVSIAYIQEDRNFVATQVFPNIPVEHQSDSYYIFDKAEFNRDDMKERAPGTESQGTGMTLSNDSYKAKVWAVHQDIADQTRKNMDTVLQGDRGATRLITQKALIRREKLFVQNHMSTGKWATDLAGVASGETLGTSFRQWNDAASKPIEDIDYASLAISESTGFRPNTMVLTPRVRAALKNHPEIIDRVKYTQNTTVDKMTDSQFASLFGVDRFLVMYGIENTAKEGQANVSGFIGGKSILLCYVAPSPGLMEPSAGYTFTWNYTGAAGPDSNVISRFRMEHLKSDRIEIEMAFDQKRTGSDLGVFMSTVIA